MSLFCCSCLSFCFRMSSQLKETSEEIGRVSTVVTPETTKSYSSIRNCLDSSFCLLLAFQKMSLLWTYSQICSKEMRELSVLLTIFRMMFSKNSLNCREKRLGMPPWSLSLASLSSLMNSLQFCFLFCSRMQGCYPKVNSKNITPKAQMSLLGFPMYFRTYSFQGAMQLNVPSRVWPKLQPSQKIDNPKSASLQRFLRISILSGLMSWCSIPLSNSTLQPFRHWQKIQQIQSSVNRDFPRLSFRSNREPPSQYSMNRQQFLQEQTLIGTISIRFQWGGSSLSIFSSLSMEALRDQFAISIILTTSLRALSPTERASQTTPNPPCPTFLSRKM